MSAPTTYRPWPSPAEERIAKAVAKGGTGALRDVPPIVLGVGPVKGVDWDDPDVMLRDVARYSPVIHPLFDAIADISGARRLGPRTYAYPMGAKNTADGFAMLLNALPAGIVRCKNRTSGYADFGFCGDYSDNCYKLQELFCYPGMAAHWNEDENLSAALQRHIDANHPTGWLSRVAIGVEFAGTQMYVRVITRGITYAPSRKASTALSTYHYDYPENAEDLSLFTPVTALEPVRKTPAQAVAIAEWLIAAGYPVTDLGEPGGLAAMRGQVMRTVTAEAVPGSPGLATLVAGADLVVPAAGKVSRGASHARAVVDAGAAAATIDEVLTIAADEPDWNIAAIIDPKVADVGAMSNAGAIDNPLLRPYQREAVAVQRATKIGMLSALAPGLGKTVCALTGMRLDALEANEAGHAYRALVAVPAAIRMQWSHETAKWFPEARVLCVRTHTDAVKLAEAIAETGTSTPLMVIASYQMLAGVADLIDKATFAEFTSVRAFLDSRDEALDEDAEVRADLAEILGRTEWNHLVCDEAALVLRNPGAKRFRALWEMRTNSSVALALTGTPVDKSLDDLGRLLAWTRGEADLFHGMRLSERFNVLDHDALVEYSKAIGPLVFRRDRSEVADELPEIRTEVVLLEGRPEETALANAARTELRRIYEDLMEKMTEAEALHPADPRYTEAKEALAMARGAILGGVTLARMAASDPAAVAASDSAGAMLLRSKGLIDKATKHPGTKRTQMVELTAELVDSGEQVLIFTDFSSVAENLVADLSAAGVPVGAVLGGQNDKVRDAMVSGYQAGELKVLVATSAAREGMNLQATTTLIHYDLPWSPSSVVQRIARANRIGAKGDALQVLIPVMAGTIEERVSSLLVARASTAMSALDGVRGVDVKGTEMGLALGGLVDSANEAELHGAEGSLLDMARAVLG